MDLKKTEQEIKIFFDKIGNSKWYAGRAVAAYLKHALKEVYKEKVELCPLITKTLSESGEPLIPEKWLILDFPKTNDVHFSDVFSYLPFEGVKTIVWIHDFQHLYLPELFSETQRNERNSIFMGVIQSAGRLVVTSESTLKDLKTFAPKYAHKARLMKIVANIPDSVYNNDFKKTQNTYNLPEKFIYLPNNFLKHKNHEIVFRAVKKLKDEGVNISICCTGLIEGFRDNAHSQNFHGSSHSQHMLQLIADLGIKDQIILLGIIPHEHVFSLMRQSICVINPSLFEGYGLSIEEARSIGKQVLLSDIAPHREQNPPKATFFDPNNLDELTKKMKKIWSESNAGPDTELENKAKKATPLRIKQSAESFMSIVKELL